MRAFIFKLILFFLFFSSLIAYNYFQAQTALRSTQPSLLTVSLPNSPSTAKVGSTVTFSWYVQAPADFKANYTTLYYGNTSTPSALNKQASPQAVGYQNKVDDYAKGPYFLPDTFTGNVQFNKVERVWFRGYALVNGNHLWSEEKYLDITP